MGELLKPPDDQGRPWSSVAGAWLGLGTAPGALLLGAGMAARHGGAVPLFSLLVGFGCIFALLWFQGSLGLVPPLGDGGNLTEVATRYFGPGMQRLIGGLIALGMIGWMGFNLGLGAAALSALIQVSQWASVLLLGLPILVLSLFGIKGWNGLAAVTTFSVLVLVVLVVTALGAHAFPVSLSLDDPLLIVTDVAVLIGYIAVFGVRAPDFTAGLRRRGDLIVVGLLLCVPMLITLLAGIDLRQGTGSDDLVAVLARPGGLAIGNLLVALAVIAPTFTIFFSGVPGLCVATGMGERAAMFVIGATGMALAIARFDQWLLSWLGILAAILPPLVVPLAVESTARRHGRAGRVVPAWVWLAGAAVSLALTLAQHPLALLAGLAASAVALVIWYRKSSVT